MSPNILSIDVEDYFQVEAFAGVVDRSQWDSYPCRVDTNTRRLLDMLDEHATQATFFILGWVADRFPGLVREIVARGHEAACHSYWHRLIYTLDREEFRLDTRRAKDVIEQAAGSAVYGYRAPSYSITSRSLWALEVLAESGFTYDSSIFPIRHDVYGIPDAPRAPFRMTTRGGPLVEYPITTFRCFGKQNLPVGGGGYLRIFPFGYTRFGISRAQRDGLPLIVYLHPWEIDPDQPRIQAPLKSRLRHYTNLDKMAGRMRRLLGQMRFTCFRDSSWEPAVQEIKFGAEAHA
jgi:polysaccharide deacetylase family protein (PEP-CTERM system associated)